MKVLFSILLLSIATGSFAFKQSKTDAITGNPLNKQSNYTINSTEPEKATMTCHFSNTSKKPAKLYIWTSPKANKPYDIIELKPAQNKPVVITKKYSFELNDHWWCLIYTPHSHLDWKFCSYFSISDETISHYRPFATWNKTTKTKETRYDCKITSPKKGVGYFFFE